MSLHFEERPKLIVLLALPLFVGFLLLLVTSCCIMMAFAVSFEKYCQSPREENLFLTSENFTKRYNCHCSCSVVELGTITGSVQGANLVVQDGCLLHFQEIVSIE